ncbi:hypothetical protein SLNHY_6264 [Streptomyces albus]|nr:hypothetical protein SLNHY_6264 [Streptomyces albus]
MTGRAPGRGIPDAPSGLRVHAPSTRPYVITFCERATSLRANGAESRTPGGRFQGLAEDDMRWLRRG